jgi:hypothetical protein
VPWLPGYPIAPETSSCESAAYVHDCWGAIDVVRLVWSLSTLRPMYVVDAREDSQRENWPQPEHKQGVTQVVAVEVDNVARAADDCTVREPWRDLAEPARQKADRH